MPPFKLDSVYSPTADQPAAIDGIAANVDAGERYTTLLGATGTGKTMTMAATIERLQRPALILAHNKTLAAQLCNEFRTYFPQNAVEYFVSYYDYYQPEAYVPSKDLYIEKDSAINQEIDRLRHAATAALFARRDRLRDAVDRRRLVGGRRIDRVELERRHSRSTVWKVPDEDSSGLARAHFGDSADMRGIVVAAKAGSDQPWLADAAADLAHQTSAAVFVVSADGVDVEALSPLPRSEYQALAQQAVDGVLERLRAAGVEAGGEVRPGLVTPAILLYAEEKDADVIVCGASTRGKVARRVLGSVPVELIQRARRPVLVITPS